MNLRALIALNPDRFYAQTWYVNEAFMDLHGTAARDGFKVAPGMPHGKGVHAIALAQLYLETPDHPRWRRYLWTSDHDALGQRIYVGVNHGKMEIHRHLNITARWGSPVWPPR